MWIYELENENQPIDATVEQLLVVERRLVGICPCRKAVYTTHHSSNKSYGARARVCITFIFIQ